jgi:hypothetical protein
MNRLTIGILIGLVLGLLGYFVTNLFVSTEIISQDFARVAIRNQSGHFAKSVLLQHESVVSTIEARGLENGKEIRFVFESRGESTYKVIVTLDNNVTLTSKEVYFEIGYRGTETITESEIITESK